jgi:hypothetical protein
LNDQVEEDEMGRACCTNREDINFLRAIVGKAEGKRPRGRPKRVWVNDIKMDIGEIEWWGMGWTDLRRIWTVAGLL